MITPCYLITRHGQVIGTGIVIGEGGMHSRTQEQYKKKDSGAGIDAVALVWTSSTQDEDHHSRMDNISLAWKSSAF